MDVPDGRIVRIIRRLALIIALVVAFLLPAGYFTLKYARLAEHIDTVAREKSGAITELVGNNPDLWQYQQLRLENVMLRYPAPLEQEQATIRSSAGKIIIVTGDTPPWPVLVRSSPVYDAGQAIAHVEIAGTYRGELYGTLAAALLSSLLGIMVYATVSILPLRALRRAMADLVREKEALREQQEHYRQLFKENPNPMWVFDDETLAFLAVNNAAVAQYGWSREEFLAMTLADTRPPEDVPLLLRQLAADREGDFHVVNHSTHRKKDGTLIDVEIRSHLVNFDGRRARIASLTDITDRQRAEKALRESEERFRNLLRDLPAIAVQSYGPGGAVQYWNTASERLYGYTASEAIGRNLLDLIVPQEMRRDVEEAVKQMLGSGQPIPASELTLMRKDGSRVTVYSSHAIVQMPGHPPELFCLDVDLTGLRKAEQSLRESEEQFRGLVEQSIAGIYIIQDDKFAYVNPRFAEIRGYDSAGELIGRAPASVVAEKDRLRIVENNRRLIAGETDSLDYTFTALRKDGSHVEVGVHSAGATYHGRPAIIGLMQDISEKIRAEEQIRRYVAQLENTFMQAVTVATTLSEMRDPYTAGHERRVAEIAVAIGTELGLDPRRVEGLRVAGYLHDVGKIMVPAEILSKPTKLTPIEYRMIQGHAQASYEVLKDVETPWPLAQVALQHHERMDGTGYPQGLKGDAILLEARIIAVADVVEAMSSHRPYRPGLGIGNALAEIERGRGTAYDRDAADACLRLFREKGYAIPA